MDEMIARAPIEDNQGVRNQDFLEDNNKVWDLIKKITYDHDCWTYVKVASRDRDRCRAYEALYNHYLGPNAVSNQASIAERKLQTTYYSGESKRFDFEKFTKMHVDQHHILENLIHHGYSGIDDRSKVRYLMDGIKSDKLEPITTRIMSNNELLEDFPCCIPLYKQYVQKLEGKKGQPLNISTTASQPVKKGKQPFTGKGNTKHQGTGGNAGKIKDQFYTPEEYRNLTPDQHNDLCKLRASRSKKQKTGEGGGQSHSECCPEHPRCSKRGCSSAPTSTSHRGCGQPHQPCPHPSTANVTGTGFTPIAQ
jgi:hypothetical protein